jgi:nuclear pore complex protein Nup205
VPLCAHKVQANKSIVHYFPALSAYISRFGGHEGDIHEADILNQRLFIQAEQNPWTLTYVHAAVRVWWLAEYSGWYGEDYDGNMSQKQQEEGSKLSVTFFMTEY